MAETPVRHTSQTDAENRAADHALRRRTGQRRIERASEAYQRSESAFVDAREHLYAVLREYADVFSGEDLTRLSPVSKQTVYKRILQQDDSSDTADAGDGDG